MTNQKTKNDTILGIDLSQDEIKSAVVVHIPHPNNFLPASQKMNSLLAKSERKVLNDWETEQLFDIKECTQVVVPFDSHFCDVELSSNVIENKQKEKKEIDSTPSDVRKVLLAESEKLMDKTLSTYYRPRLKNLLQVCQEKINQHGFCLLIDGYSFPEFPLKTEVKQDLYYPDICIEIDSFHTPKSLTTQLTQHFESNGLSVSINKTNSGVMVPLSMYQQEKRLLSVMINVNKRTYKKNGKILSKKIDQLQEIMNGIFD